MTKSANNRQYGKRPLSNVLRREIRKARLKVTLDQELGRPTSDEVKLLAAMDLPRIVRGTCQDENAADRRTCDSANEEPAPGASRREILVARLKVSANELLGRGISSELMRRSRVKLAPIMSGMHAAHDVAR
ncbi:hypothetical protein [Specibacter sp. RAF43]|uniref:hypothetical protein n=1 Tax=Specibacter sp. RAF43 TaxID=3233057 RepID=UPI003F9DB118